jgi:hypothetical protein
VELAGADSKMLLQGSLSGVGARMTSYPTTTDLRLDITMVGGPGGPGPGGPGPGGPQLGGRVIGALGLGGGRWAREGGRCCLVGQKTAGSPPLAAAASACFHKEGCLSLPMTTLCHGSRPASPQFGVHSSHGPLLSSGMLTRTGAPAPVRGPAAAAGAPGAPPPPPGGRAGGAVSLHLLKHPQDGSADYVARLAVAPSYVTYNRYAITEVAEFFKSDRPMELSRLQAQAAARTDKLRHMAQLQLKAMSLRNAKEKPSLLLGVTMHAPKVAIPGAAAPGPSRPGPFRGLGEGAGRPRAAVRGARKALRACLSWGMGDGALPGPVRLIRKRSSRAFALPLGWALLNLPGTSAGPRLPPPARLPPRVQTRTAPPRSSPTWVASRLSLTPSC